MSGSRGVDNGGVCLNIEAARLCCAEIVDCSVKRGYNKRRTNTQIYCSFSNFAKPSTVRESHTTHHLYINVQFHPGLPYVKGIS